MDTSSPLLLPIPETIAGPRVRLAHYQPAHAPALWEAVEASRDRLEPWLRWPRDIHSSDHARERILRLHADWLLRDRLAWGLFESTTERLLGEVAMVHIDWTGRVFELAYWLRTDAEVHGYMREAVAVVTRLSFEDLGANRVAVRVEADNVRSRRVPEGLGYVLEGTLRRDHLGLDGEPTDVLVFALTADDYSRLEWRLITG